MFASPAYTWGHRRRLGDVVLSWLRTVFAWFSELADAHPVGYVILMLALAAVLLAILVHLSWVLAQALRPRRPTPAEAPLDAVVPHDARWHLAQAAAAAAAGRYREALAHRFLALVLELDRRRAVTAHAAKTPAEYAREARLDPEHRRALHELVAVLYAHAYGGAPTGPRDWAAFDGAAHAVGGGHVAAI